jgi:HEAT repeat protein
VLERFAGSRVRCPTCGDAVTVPPMGIPVEGVPTVPAIADEPAPPPPPSPSKRGSGATIALLLVAFMVFSCCGGIGIVGAILVLREPPSSVSESFANSSSASGRAGVRPSEKVGDKEPARDPGPVEPAQPNPESPSYLVQELRASNAVRAEEARAKLIELGRAAVLELRRALRDRDAKLRVAVASILGDMGEHASGAIDDLTKALADNDAGVRAAAARSLGRLGALSHPALAALLKTTADAEQPVRDAAEAALPKVGPILAADVATLLPLWSESAATKRDRYFSVLLSLKPGSALVGPLFAPLVLDSERKLQLPAMKAVGDAGSPAHAAAFGKLLIVAANQDGGLRGSALAALAKIGPAVAADRHDLETALRAEPKDTRLFALAQMGELGAAAGPSAPDIARLLRDFDPAVKTAAAKALVSIGKPAAIVLPDIMVAAHDPDAGVRVAANQALGRLGRDARIVGLLFDALNDQAREVRESAAKTLRGVDPPLGRDDLPALRAALKGKTAESRRCAAAELARLGPDAAPAVDDLLAAARDEDYEVRRYAFAALPTFGERGKQALPIIIETMAKIIEDGGKQPGSVELFHQASAALLKLGDPLDALPIWNKGLKARDHGLRKEVVKAIASVGAPARKAARDLCGSLDDAELTDAVSETLLALGGTEVVNALVEVVDEGTSYEAKLAAVHILGKMGPAAKDAFQALYKASTRYAGRDLGKAAGEALKQIQRK